MHSKLLFFFLWLVPIFVSAQVTQEWVQRYNDPYNHTDGATSICVDASGNVYVTGESEGNGTEYDYATIKYNSAGVLQWVQRYNGPINSDDIANAIALDNFGNVYVTGVSYTGQSADFTTIKYTTSGVEQWIRRYTRPGNWLNTPYFIAVDASGNVYIAGQSGYPDIGSSHFDYQIVKYNGAGVLLWAQIYNGTGNNYDDPTSFSIDSFGNVYITGQSKGIGTDHDFATIKYNTNGVVQWIQRYDGPIHNRDIANSLSVDSSGNVYVTGESLSTVSNNEYTTIKYNSSGVQEWVQRYDANNYYVGNSIKADRFGNIYVTGNGNHDYITIKYDSFGTLYWVRSYDGVGNEDIAYNLCTDDWGNVYVTGFSTGNGTHYDLTTISYTSSGNQRWVQRYNGPGNSRDGALDIKVDFFGNIYVAGFSIGSGTGDDYVTIKYSQDVDIQQISVEIPEKFLLSQNYPNPFNPTTNIKFAIPKKSFVKLVIYNSLGKEVATLVNAELSAGSYQADWDASGYPSGVYFYRFEADDFVETRSMVLVK